MSDVDQTVYSGGGAQSAPGTPQSSYQAPAAKRSPLLIIGGIALILGLLGLRKSRKKISRFQRNRKSLTYNLKRSAIMGPCA